MACLLLGLSAHFGFRGGLAGGFLLCCLARLLLGSFTRLFFSGLAGGFLFGSFTRLFFSGLAGGFRLGSCTRLFFSGRASGFRLGSFTGLFFSGLASDFLLGSFTGLFFSGLAGGFLLGSFTRLYILSTTLFHRLPPSSFLPRSLTSLLRFRRHFPSSSLLRSLTSLRFRRHFPSSFLFLTFRFPPRLPSLPLPSLLPFRSPRRVRPARREEASASRGPPPPKFGVGTQIHPSPVLPATQ